MQTLRVNNENYIIVLLFFINICSYRYRLHSCSKFFLCEDCCPLCSGFIFLLAPLDMTNFSLCFHDALVYFCQFFYHLQELLDLKSKQHTGTQLVEELRKQANDVLPFTSTHFVASFISLLTEVALFNSKPFFPL